MEQLTELLGGGCGHDCAAGWVDGGSRESMADRIAKLIDTHQPNAVAFQVTNEATQVTSHSLRRGVRE
jgi:hypothetical protein